MVKFWVSSMMRNPMSQYFITVSSWIMGVSFFMPTPWHHRCITHW